MERRKTLELFFSSCSKKIGRLCLRLKMRASPWLQQRRWGWWCRGIRRTALIHCIIHIFSSPKTRHITDKKYITTTFSCFVLCCCCSYLFSISSSIMPCSQNFFSLSSMLITITACRMCRTIDSERRRHEKNSPHMLTLAVQCSAHTQKKEQDFLRFLEKFHLVTCTPHGYRRDRRTGKWKATTTTYSFLLHRQWRQGESNNSSTKTSSFHNLIKNFLFSS